jgi:hypothetical protein
MIEFFTTRLALIKCYGDEIDRRAWESLSGSMLGFFALFWNGLVGAIVLGLEIAASIIFYPFRVDEAEGTWSRLYRIFNHPESSDEAVLAMLLVSLLLGGLVRVIWTILTPLDPDYEKRATPEQIRNTPSETSQ